MSYQVKLSLCSIRPEIWRRLKIPPGISFEGLHRIIQAAFGWQDYHLYKFQFGNMIITVPDDTYAPGELYGADTVELDSSVTCIDEFIGKYDKGIYTYDFGDLWEHEIILEKMLKDTAAVPIPVCLGGARSRPPEDVGGSGGYENFLKIIKDVTNPEREEYLEWSRKDARGRLFDPEYFHADEVNEKLLHVLEDTPEASTGIFSSRDGLKGELEFDLYGPCIETPKGKYSWDRIGEMLRWIDDGYDISIKIREHKGDRSKYPDDKNACAANEKVDTRTQDLLMNALERAKEYGRELDEKRERELWGNVTLPISLLNTLFGLTKNELDGIRKNLDLKNLSALKKADLASRLAKSMPAAAEKVIKTLDKGRYDLIKAIVKNSGHIAVPGIGASEIEALMRYGIVFPGIFNDRKVLFTPNEIVETFLRIDGTDLEKTIYRNTEWIYLTHGLLYYYGVAETWPICEKIDRITGQKIDFREYLDVMAFASDFYGQVSLSYYGFVEHRVFDAKKIAKEHEMRPEVDFYPFSKKQLLKAGRQDYVERTPAMNSFIGFLSEYYEIDDELADEIAMQLNNMTNMEAKEEIVLKYLQSLLEFPSDDYFMEGLSAKLMDVHNSTRMWVLKGHTPEELLQEEKHDQEPLAPEYIKAVPKESKVIDIKTREKVGRNDPCPCGSGKKYKKCCGK